MASQQEAKPEALDVLPKETASLDGTPPIQADAPPPPAKAASEPELPVVEAPKLDGGGAIASPPFVPQPSAQERAAAAPSAAVSPIAAAAASAAREEPSELTGSSSGGAATSGGAPARLSRFALLAASVAVAACLGSFAGSLSASGVAHLWPASAPVHSRTDTSALQAMKMQLAELSALKSNVDAASRNANGQFAKLADRLDRVEHSQAEPAARLARIADAVDRLEKKTIAAAASPETTGSIASSRSQAASDAHPPDRVLQDWIVQEVRGGRALVMSRFGGVFEVAAGSTLPGLGRVDDVKRQDGQWVVVTPRGLITGH